MEEMEEREAGGGGGRMGCTQNKNPHIGELMHCAMFAQLASAKEMRIGATMPRISAPG